MTAARAGVLQSAMDPAFYCTTRRRPANWVSAKWLQNNDLCRRANVVHLLLNTVPSDRHSWTPTDDDLSSNSLPREKP
jgi:hypothetical protein